jgi:hypothetical protein
MRLLLLLVLACGEAGTFELDGSVPQQPSAEAACETLGHSDCVAAANCHAVYGLSPACVCDVPGCCHAFERCAQGANAICNQDKIGCLRQAPYCEGPYVISFHGACYEGCAHESECAP